MAVSSLVTTIGGETSNSYVSLTEANQFHEDRLNTSDWDDASTDDRTKALLQAAIRLDQVEWEGRRHEEDQALAWPRAGAADQDGWAIETDEIPEKIKRAQMELALHMLAEDLLADTGLEGFDSAKVGPLEVDIRHARKPGTLPEHVRRMIEPFLRTTSRLNFRMERA